MTTYAMPTGRFAYTGKDHWIKGTDFIAAFGDANKDGRVTRSEFRTRLDTNRDGMVDAREFKAALQKFNDTYNQKTGLPVKFRVNLGELYGHDDFQPGLRDFAVGVKSLFNRLNVSRSGASANVLDKADFRGSDPYWGKGDKDWQGSKDPWLTGRDVTRLLGRARFQENESSYSDRGDGDYYLQDE